ncbi:ATP-binding protein [Pleomorphovibrio marinus]|uniref:ATP-binding protein n=1 Tax=Pleomorphovibrio marinus TaxID=2164132 RepID=UPI000E0A7598|nr:ATP-binding protein [Pleomorphovibrio marinus]
MLKNRRVIIFSTILVIGAILAGNLLWKKEPGSHSYGEEIQSKMSKIIEEFNDDFVDIVINIRRDKQVSFQTLNIATNHSFYLFSMDGSLIYWSDITMIPAFGELDLNRKFQLLDNAKGQYFSNVRKVSRGVNEYWVVQVYPLFDKVEVQNEYIRAGHNPDVFGNDRFKLLREPENDFIDLYHEGDHLFSVYFMVGYESVGAFSSRTLLVFFFSLLGLVLLLGGDFVITLWHKGKHFASLFYTAVILSSIRLMMIAFKFPQNFFEAGLFNSSFYSSSWLNPSLGDLLLNVFCSLVVLTMMVGILSRKRFLINFIQVRDNYNNAWFLFLAYALSTCFLVLFYTLFTNIVSNSQWNLNVVAVINLDYFKVISLIIIFLGGAGYLLFSILVLNMVLFKSPIDKKQALNYLLYFSLPIAVGLFYFDRPLMVAFLVHFILLGSIIAFSLYNNLYKLELDTFLTFFFGCLLGAMITGTASYQHLVAESVREKKQFGSNILEENNKFAEYLLSEVMSKVQEDIFIQSRLGDPFLSKEPIEQKIKKVYLSNYFDQYVAEIRIFNRAGESLLNRERERPLIEFRKQYMNSDNTTTFRNLYYDRGTESGRSNRYAAFINMYRENIFLGTIMLELTQQRMLTSSVYPKLLTDSRFEYDVAMGGNDFAIYQEGFLRTSSGVFNYRDPGMEDVLDDEAISDFGVTYNGYHHLAVKGERSTVVISSPSYPVHYVLADTALFFVTYLLLTLISIFVYVLFFSLDQVKFTYSTKLQFYLNFAFFFPMIVISVVSMGFLSQSYTEDLHNQYFEKASIIRDNLTSYWEERINGVINREELLDQLTYLAKNTNSDINIYLPTGRLMATNQRTIFDKKILTEYINPYAYASLIEAQNNRLLLREEVSKLSYKTVYLGLRDSERQRVQAIIAIPFFESEDELNDLIADVFSNILIIFVVIFIIFLAISYFVSKHLTYPFKLLTQKLKVTDLESNEYMNWPTKDEIGLLVDEYNNMLSKLEASKKVLSSTEKETAWREMAKQVAHEIKNPLTPMKLTLQHLLRLQAAGKLEDPSKLKKPVETLIHQVDTLSDIATSFSTFAKMPLPKNESMDFRVVVAEVVELYSNREDICFSFQDNSQQEKPMIIMGDPKLFGRVISNLIINGIQSVPSNRKPNIQLNLSSSNGELTLEIKDDGSGIPEELEGKIFIPNFSTKSEGSGLGLAIAKRGVETAGGKIWFETKLGEGTSFFLSFPLS